MKAIYLDMDDTIAKLYDVENWLEQLRQEDETPYRIARPIPQIAELDQILNAIAAHDITIGVISWGAMNASKDYNKRVRQVKKMWINQYLTCVTEFHVVKYNTPKHKVAKIKDSILIDDNANVRKAWKNGATIDASNSEEMMENLRKLLDILKAA